MDDIIRKFVLEPTVAMQRDVDGALRAVQEMLPKAAGKQTVPSSGSQSQNVNKTTACRWHNSAKGCARGKDCKFSHAGGNDHRVHTTTAQVKKEPAKAGRPEGDQRGSKLSGQWPYDGLHQVLREGYRGWAKEGLGVQQMWDRANTTWKGMSEKAKQEALTRAKEAEKRKKNIVCHGCGMKGHIQAKCRTNRVHLTQDDAGWV